LSAGQAAHILVLLKSIFNWGKRRPAWKQVGLSINPAEDIMRPYKPRPRKRFLSDDEIRTVWFAVEEAGMTEAGRIAMRLTLATGQRPGEVIGIAKSELHLEDTEPFWLIPEGRTKNSNEHKLPLSRMALKLIEKALAILDKEERDSDFLFPSPRKNKGDRSCGEGLIRRGLDRMFRDGLWTGKRFSPHDLRRTVASHMAALGVDRTVIGKVLNHISMDNASVTGMHYDQHLYAEEKRHALELWAQKLEGILGEEKEAQ